MLKVAWRLPYTIWGSKTNSVIISLLFPNDSNAKNSLGCNSFAEAFIPSRQSLAIPFIFIVILSFPWNKLFGNTKMKKRLPLITLHGRNSLRPFSWVYWINEELATIAYCMKENFTMTPFISLNFWLRVEVSYSKFLSSPIANNNIFINSMNHPKS